MCPPPNISTIYDIYCSYNWTRAWLNIMFFRASMDSLHGTSSVNIADWPHSPCQLLPQASSPSADAAAVMAVNVPSFGVKRETPHYETRFQPFKLRPDNKILVQDGSLRDSSSTMLKVRLLVDALFHFTLSDNRLFFACRTIMEKHSAQITLLQQPSFLLVTKLLLECISVRTRSAL